MARFVIIFNIFIVISLLDYIMFDIAIVVDVTARASKLDYNFCHIKDEFCIENRKSFKGQCLSHVRFYIYANELMEDIIGSTKLNITFLLQHNSPDCSIKKQIS